MKWFFLASVSVVGWIIALPFIPIQLGHRVFSRKYDLPYYFRQIAVGNDVTIGSMVYGSKHTVSAITGKKARDGDAYHLLQLKVIDLLFGDGHCYDQYVKEYEGK